MVIREAQCDMENCQKIIKPQEGEELFVVGEMQICRDCYSGAYDDLTVEEYDES